ncbi:beta-glucoside-specific PTS transporter subunit IIABC [Companilactobacillus formosensis]|uniref:beta-glucoside-specific PTS transporter subunit IIABC n=1 Tax=Companilactobacillus formosensis TaxID=1617889 RepID=UPI000E652D67|nr:beta-glucoside-specific PTS transporter subunit IIABC [Companilactobacillus formosensis]
MTKKYNKLAKDIVKDIGGKENVSNVYHCQTRLRFHLKDDTKADRESLKQLNGVVQIVEKGGVFQVVIGTNVADVFEEIAKFVDDSAIEDTSSDKSIEKENIGNRIIDFVSGTFQPLIPALSGAGMVKAVLALLVVFNLITVKSQTYIVLNMFADTVFAFLPILLAASEARKLKCNSILAMGIAAMMLNPTWTQLVTAGKPVHLFDIIPLGLTNYTYSVIPIILIIFVQSYVEKYLHRIIPESVELVFVPMLVFLIMGILAFSVLGPIGSYLGNYLAAFFTFLSTNASWAPSVIVGGFLPIMVMFGLHNAVAPLGIMQMASKGFDSIFGPGCVCSNMAQATAGAIVAWRTKDPKIKQIATSGSITAYMGITEPILYGVSLPKKYPLVATMIGGGFGGLYAGLTHTHRFATGSSGLPAILLYIGNNTVSFLINIVIAIIISVVITGILTYILSLKFEKGVDSKEITTGAITIKSPVKGEVLPLSEAKDDVFSSGALGKGVVIHPSEGKIYAPVSGTVSTLFPTKHAIGIISDSGVEVLIHIGIDTVDLNGKFYESFVKQGDHVTTGDLLIKCDLDGIKNAGYFTDTMVIITNTDKYSDIKVDESKSIDLTNNVLEITV